jgi:uncharacterized delta-60 repeat protein
MTPVTRVVARASAVLALLVTWAAPAAAAPGDLDTSFSGDGWVRTLEVRTETNNYLPEGAEDLAIQPDGKILAVGELEDGTSHWYFGVFRYLANGDLDDSFGEGGWVDTDLGSFEFAHAVALQPDGKIVVAGEGDCEFATCFVLVRYNENGSLDSTFGGGDGVVRTMFRQCGCWALDVAIQPNGKIVAAGWRFRYGDALDDDLFAVARYLPDGALDRTFSGDGRVSVDLGFGDDIIHSLAVLPGGKVLVAGQGTRNRYLTEDDFALARFRNDGRLDSSFSGDGLRTINFGRRRYDVAYSLDVQDDGRILIAGSSSDELESHPRLAVARLHPDGALDASFGRGGLRRFRPGPYGGYARAIVQHPDGRVLVAGRRFVDADHDPSDWILARYLRNGTLDPSFGGDGIVVTDYGTGADRADALAIQDDGKILVGGSIYESLGLARYHAE